MVERCPGPLRDPSAPRYLLMVGRDDWRRDSTLNRVLLDGLARHGLQVVWEDAAAQWVHRCPAAAPRWLLRGVQLAYALTHWRYAGYLLRRRARTLESRCASLQHTVRQLGDPARTVVLARSSGGRVASQVADGLGLRALVCLGYPFRHPEAGDEPARYAHLATLRTPLHILQGERDVYGGREVVQRYRLSPAVTLRFFDTDHDFRPGEAGAGPVLRAIEEALGLVAR